MREIKLKLENMHCDACVRHVTKALEKAGANIDEVHVGSARVHAPDTVDDPAILEALNKAGYPATVETVSA